MEVPDVEEDLPRDGEPCRAGDVYRRERYLGPLN
jgi:hypothetical protein